ncbi:MAG: hypothetical protein FJ137_01645 [Deltaproteobacteria bacterium]|nr:hypothetical protein [Deltaproteobacteria bacterium]
MRALSLLGLAFAISPLTTGCGPILTVWLISDAEAKLAGARAAQAEQNAVYEFTAAEAYLTKAHEELGYADYGPAIDYAFKANNLAAQGAERARDQRSKHLDQQDSSGSTSQDAPSAPPTPPSARAPSGVTIKKSPSTSGQGSPQ